MKDHLAPREAVTAHRHQEAYISFVVAGSYEERSIDGVFSYGPGALVFHPPMHCHSNVAGPEGATIINTLLPKGALRLDEYAYVDIGRTNRVSEIPVESDLSELKALAAEKKKLQSAPMEPPWLHRALTLLSETDCDDVSLQSVSDELNLSPEHISRCFKSVFGFGPNAYKNEIRLRKAINLLQDGERPSFVAAALGFADHSHLCRILRKNVGKSPTEIAAADF